MFFWYLGATVVLVFMTLGRRSIDYRVVMLGAILPDLIDKPIGRIFFEDEFQNSRVFGHTLLFALVLVLAIQFTLRGRTARHWFVLPIACLIHLALDGMWSQPITLFWPLFGTKFPIVTVENYWLEELRNLFVHPLGLFEEVAGVLMLLYVGYAYGLNQKDRLKAFLKTGALTDKLPA